MQSPFSSIPLQQTAAPATLKPYPGQVENITVHTKFPVARIKRIMQADEDVGKVAQVTPTAVSKALELFMISLVTKSAAKAREKGSKKVTAGHLKGVVVGDESFDFLLDIVGKIPDAGEKAGRGGARGKGADTGGEGSEEDVTTSNAGGGGGGNGNGNGNVEGAGGKAAGAKRKRAAGGGRRAKPRDSDDE
jgi:Dr1-associated corepressor